jgi:hypothetical protein
MERAVDCRFFCVAAMIVNNLIERSVFAIDVTVQTERRYK